MLGKRFRRTTSMSHLGPRFGPAVRDPALTEKSDKKVQGMHEYNAACCVPLQAATQKEVDQGRQNDAGRNGGSANMADELDPPHMFSDAMISCEGHDEELSIGAHEESLTLPPVQMYTPPPLVSYQMGLWTEDNHVSRGKLHEHYMGAEGSISPVHFLDVCFYCKRRLRHERDIFIYRGDSAFCSEECRHLQISSDERRSLRGAKSKRPATCETAVAA